MGRLRDFRQKLSVLILVGGMVVLPMHAIASSTTPPTPTPTSPQILANMPTEVSDRILQTVARQRHLPISELTLEEALAQHWNGCWGLYPPDVACNEAAIPGWRVLVRRGSQHWIYHTNQDGSVIRLNQVASQTETPIEPGLILGSEALTVDTGVLFISLSSGRSPAQNYGFQLRSDGRLMYVDGTTPLRQIRQLSSTQLQQFMEALEQNRFQDFNGVSYRSTLNSVESPMVLLITPNSLTEYAAVGQTSLPPELQRIIQGWNQLNRR